MRCWLPSIVPWVAHLVPRGAVKTKTRENNQLHGHDVGLPAFEATPQGHKKFGELFAKLLCWPTLQGECTHATRKPSPPNCATSEMTCRDAWGTLHVFHADAARARQVSSPRTRSSAKMQSTRSTQCLHWCSGGSHEPLDVDPTDCKRWLARARGSLKLEYYRIGCGGFSLLDPPAHICSRVLLRCLRRWVLLFVGSCPCWSGFGLAL